MATSTVSANYGAKATLPEALGRDTLAGYEVGDLESSNHRFSDQHRYCVLHCTTGLNPETSFHNLTVSRVFSRCFSLHPVAASNGSSS
jgi:hypothetical protein